MKIYVAGILFIKSFSSRYTSTTPPLRGGGGVTYSWLPSCLDVGSGSSVDHASGGVGGVLASLTTMVKECCGSSFLTILPLFGHTFVFVIEQVFWIKRNQYVYAQSLSKKVLNMCRGVHNKLVLHLVIKGFQAFALEVSDCKVSVRGKL